MQTFFLLLTVIISRAVPSPIAQLNPDYSFDIASSAFDDPAISAIEPFQLAQSETQPPEAPTQAPPDGLRIPQPGDQVFKKGPQSNSEEPTSAGQAPKTSKPPFNCADGKSAACCVGTTSGGLTSACISYVPFDEWCQNQQFFKCCKAQPDKDSAIRAGTLVDDHLREDCDDPLEVEWSPLQRFQNFGNNLLHGIIPQVDTGASFPEPVWIPGQ